MSLIVLESKSGKVISQFTTIINDLRSFRDGNVHLWGQSKTLAVDALFMSSPGQNVDLLKCLGGFVCKFLQICCNDIHMSLIVSMLERWR